MAAAVLLVQALGGGWTAAELPSPADVRVGAHDPGRFYVKSLSQNQIPLVGGSR
jgi:hypothetical protein